MKQILKYLFLLCLAFQAFAAAASDFPKTSLEAALKRGAAEGKNVLLYLSATWCGPCKMMDKEVFPDQTLKAELQKWYIPIEMDGESWRGEKIRKEFRVTPFPTFLILSPDRKVVRRAEGAMDIPKFMEFISNSKDNEVLRETVFQAIVRSPNARTKPNTIIGFGIRLGTTLAWPTLPEAVTLVTRSVSLEL